jgi:hypothetical protein
MVQVRFGRVVEHQTPRGQGGFRSREECVAQIVSLYDVVKRRLRSDTPTIITFWDFHRAYDSVSHIGFLCKLKQAGFDPSGRLYRFVRALYEAPTLSVRFATGMHTELVDLLEGLRQGCPLSPGFFNFFVQDLSSVLDEVGGVSVPGLQEGISHLLFADDLTTLSGTVDGLVRTTGAAVAWAAQNQMAFNPGKMLVLVVAPTEDQRQEIKDEIAARNVCVQGVRIPVVTEATCLGLLLHESWDLTHMVNARVKHGLALVESMRSFLQCTLVPIALRSLVISSCVIPTMLYGAEVWATKVLSAKVQGVVNIACRYVLRLPRTTASVSVVAMLAELGLAPCFALAFARRIRLWAKAPALSTWIEQLVKHEYKLCWSRQTAQCVKRYGLDLSGIDAGDVYQRALGHLSVRWHLPAEVHMKAKSAIGYRAHQMYRTALGSKNFEWSVKHGVELNQLAKSRCGGLFLGSKAWRVNADWMVNRPEASNVCVFCTEMVECVDEPETDSHLWIRCPKWDYLRKKYQLDQRIAEITACLVKAEKPAVVVLPGDGEAVVAPALDDSGSARSSSGVSGGGGSVESGADSVSVSSNASREAREAARRVRDDHVCRILQGGSFQNTAVKEWALAFKASAPIVSVQSSRNGKEIQIRHGSLQSAMFLDEVMRARAIAIRDIKASLKDAE